MLTLYPEKSPLSKNNNQVASRVNILLQLTLTLSVYTRHRSGVHTAFALGLVEPVNKWGTRVAFQAEDGISRRSLPLFHCDHSTCLLDTDETTQHFS